MIDLPLHMPSRFGHIEANITRQTEAIGAANYFGAFPVVRCIGSAFTGTGGRHLIALVCVHIN